MNMPWDANPGHSLHRRSVPRHAVRRLWHARSLLEVPQGAIEEGGSRGGREAGTPNWWTKLLQWAGLDFILLTGKPVLVTKYGQVAPDLYLDPASGKVLKFDHVKRVSRKNFTLFHTNFTLILFYYILTIFLFSDNLSF